MVSLLQKKSPRSSNEAEKAKQHFAHVPLQEGLFFLYTITCEIKKKIISLTSLHLDLPLKCFNMQFESKRVKTPLNTFGRVFKP